MPHRPAVGALIIDLGVSPPASAGGENPNKLFGKKLEQKLTYICNVVQSAT